jgi:hypothetical protein
MCSILLLFVQSKEMPRKTFKKSRKQRRRTLRRLRKNKKGGADSQSLEIPSASFGPKIGAPVNSDNAWHKIA